MSAWEEFENHVCRITHGTKTPASGRLHHKGDIWAGPLMIECKQRRVPVPVPNTLPLDKDWFTTVLTHARATDNKIPLVAVQFTTGEQDLLTAGTYYLCRQGDVDLFERSPHQNKLSAIPEWVAVTERSVQLFLKNYALAHPEEKLPLAKREFSGGSHSGFSGSGSLGGTRKGFGVGRGFRGNPRKLGQ